MRADKTLVFILGLSLLLIHCERTEIDDQDLIVDTIPLNDTVQIEISDTTTFLFADIEFSLKDHVLQDFFIKSIDFDNNGHAWIASYHYDSMNISIIDSTIDQRTTHIVFYENEFINEIQIDAANNVWMGYGGGLIKYDRKSWTIYNSSNSPIHARVSQIEIDSAGLLWINSGNSLGGGLYAFDGNSEWVSYTYEANDLPASITQGLAIDNSQTVWTSLSNSSYNCYVCAIYDDTIITHSNENFGFFPYYMGEIAVCKNSEILAINDYSLSSNFTNPPPYVFNYNSIEWEACDFIDPETGNNLYCSLIKSDKQGDIWGAFYYSIDGGQKIAVYNGNRWITSENMASIQGLIYDIAQSPNGDIWICSSEGIYILEKRIIPRR